MILTNKQARQFLLRRHGLLGERIYKSKNGVMKFIRRVGCVQFDPVDICGRTADITLHSRVEGYKKQMLDILLYKERRLIDFFDKNLSIFPVEDLAVFRQEHIKDGYAEAFDERGGDAVRQIMPLIRTLIKERGFLSAKDVEVDKKIIWHWGTVTSLPRAALESMYFRGELIIHHKTGTNKSYAFAEDHIPENILNAPSPFKNEDERLAWHVKRRIGAVGMLWNRASDAFLGLSLKAEQRTAAFKKLLADDGIFEVFVKGIKEPLYILKDELALAEDVLRAEKYPPRIEFIAPLDNLLWDRRLIEVLFGFVYRWEIYTPKEKRKYGAYTLPILYDDSFIGRADFARKDGILFINNIWTESGKSLQGRIKAAFNECAKRFADLNECGNYLCV